jgi:hypothetical protein
MTTAMEQALARIELLYGMKPDAIHWEMFKNDCMEKEKEQIIDAHLNGQQDHHFSLESRMAESEDFYNQTYNQNK